jgi:Protein of unknown function (DUF3987)
MPILEEHSTAHTLTTQKDKLKHSTPLDIRNDEWKRQQAAENKLNSVCPKAPPAPISAHSANITATTTANITANITAPTFIGPNAALLSKLPMLMQEAISVVQELHNAPDEMALQAVLGVINFACQHQCNVDSIAYKKRPLSLYLLAIAPTGTRKSTVYEELMVGVNKWLTRQGVQYNKDLKNQEIAEAQYKRDMKDFDKGKIQIPPTKPAPVQTPHYISAVGTRNGIINALQTQPFIGLFGDEGGEFFNGHSFQGGKNGQTQATEMTTFLTKLYEAGEASRQTGMDHTTLRNRRMCMLFMLQDSVIKDVLLNDTFAKQGFIHRLLITSSKTYTTKDIDRSKAGRQIIEATRKRLDPFHAHIEQLLNKKVLLHTDEHRQFELNLPTIEMTDDASKLLDTFTNTHKDGNLFNSDVEQRWSDFATRLDEFPLRLAANLAVFEGKSEIDVASMEAGIELYKFYVAQRTTAIDLTRDTVAAPSVKCANDIMKWMNRKAKTEATTRDLTQFVYSFKNLDTSDRNKVITLLESDHNCIFDKDSKSIVIKKAA